MSLRETILDRFAPNSVAVIQWLNGKPTRDDVLNYLQFTVDQLEDIKKFLVDTMGEFDKKTNQIFAAMRLQSHQIDTLVRMTSDGSPEGRQKFYHELRRTMTFAEFIDGLISKRGVHYAKSMNEKLEMLRGWNKQEDVIKCDFDALQLQSYITDFPDHFTSEEIASLEKEFHFSVGKPTSNITIGDDVNVERIAE